jgi:hypothetical protein
VRLAVKFPALQSSTPGPRAGWHAVVAFCAAALLGITAARAIAQDAPSHLDQLIAGYVLNFTKFVEWPAVSRSEDLVICVAGNPGLYTALQAGAEGASVGSRHIALRKVDNAAAAAGCHVLYIETASPLLRLAQASAGPVLTVSDGTGFTHAGGTIELFTQQNKLRFIVNLANAKRAGLRISSNLLQLAASVEGGDQR